jgi:hypothetical protein
MVDNITITTWTTSLSNLKQYWRQYHNNNMNKSSIKPYTVKVDNITKNHEQLLIEEWFMLWLLYCLPVLFKVWQRSDSCCSCNIFYQYCLRFDREVVHVVVVVLSTITIVNVNHFFIKPLTVLVEHITTTTSTTPLSNHKQ